ncbi:MAG: MFS transporter [Candidatus Micrarchaeaceae archaeon]
MDYKWIVLANTTLGTIMSSININVVIVSLPSIFRGLGINPFLPGEFVFLLWILMGYSIVIASFLVTLGKISDMYGKARLYTIGFVIFAIASIFLSFIPDESGNFGAILLIFFRMIQAVGGSFLMVNSAALLTDAFPPNERGKALGLNQVSLIVGTLLGLVVGGILASYNWHFVFLLSVPFAIAGALWSIFKLNRKYEKKEVKIDYLGNISLALCLVFASLGFTYALLPYKSSLLGWSDPFVVASFLISLIFLILFVAVERKEGEPLFDLSLFNSRPFAFGNLSLFFSSMARGALMFLLVVCYQKQKRKSLKGR